MRLTIITTSYNRPQEFLTFVNSINNQRDFNFNDLQIIFVDQGNNKSIFDRLNKNIDKTYIKIDRCSLSLARNIALPYVKGDIVHFGDDDEWYTHNVFRDVLNAFNEGLDGVMIRCKDNQGEDINNYPNKKKCLKYFKHYGAMSPSIFLLYDSNILFDENIGVGSRYGLSSGEETDYLLTYMERHNKYKIVYFPNIIAHHPKESPRDFKSFEKKAYYYSRGAGYVIRKHPIPYYMKCILIFRPLIGCIVYSVFNRQKCKVCFLKFKGKVEGYFYYSKVLKQ